VFPTRSDGPVTLFTLFVRYGIGSIALIAGVVLLLVNPGGFGVEGFGLAWGAGLSVLMLNWMFRVGVAGDKEREQHEDDWHYFEEHGHWPDEHARPPRPQPRPGRRPPGSGTHR
jgi:hypothetical protein